LATKLANPLASMVSVPFQYDWNSGYTDDNGTSNVLIVQPIIPVKLNKKWNLINRPVIPIVLKQTDIAGNSGSQSGLGDILYSAWLSPSTPTDLGGLGDFVWGLGTAISIPTATSKLTGSGKLSIGPTAIFLLINKGLTVGALMNQLWSVAGESMRDDVDALYLQPFISYTTKSAFGIGINLESTYDWIDDEWSIPVNLYFTQLFNVGDQKVQAKFGVRYWADSTPSGPDGWGVRFGLTYLFPK